MKFFIGSLKPLDEPEKPSKANFSGCGCAFTIGMTVLVSSQFQAVRNIFFQLLEWWRG